MKNKFFCYDCKDDITNKESYAMRVEGEPMGYLFFFCHLCADKKSKEFRKKHPEFGRSLGYRPRF